MQPSTELRDKFSRLLKPFWKGDDDDDDQGPKGPPLFSLPLLPRMMMQPPRAALA